MKILKAVLLSVFIVSLTWSLLIFAGPSIVERVFKYYSDSKAELYQIVVTPSLDIRIGRLDYKLNAFSSNNDKKYSFTDLKFSWALDGFRPNFDLLIGAVNYTNIAVANDIDITMSPASLFRWEKPDLYLRANRIVHKKGLELNGFYSEGVFSLENFSLENFTFGLKEASVDRPESIRISDIFGSFDSINLIVPLKEQRNSLILESSKSGSKERGVSIGRSFYKVINSFGKLETTGSYKNISHPSSLAEISSIEFDVLFDFELDTLVKSFKAYLVDGKIGQLGAEFDQINLVAQSENHEYVMELSGRLSELELTANGLFLGKLENSSFKSSIFFGVPSKVPRVSASSLVELSMNPSIEIDLDIVAMYDFLALKGCADLSCALADAALDFNITVDDEIINGQVNCTNAGCANNEWLYNIKTSNTDALLSSVGKVGTINPIFVLYLYGFFKDGTPIDNGHHISN